MHVFKPLLHIPHQFKLSAAAIQILLRIADVEIIVAVQIIRQEPDTTFQSHQSRTPWKVFQLRFCQYAVCPLQEASGEDLIQPQVKIHLTQILFILRTVIRAETDGITEIVNGKARHGGVQINDANALVAFPVN